MSVALLESKTGFKSVDPTLVDDFLNVELHSPVHSKNSNLQVRGLTQGTILLSKALPVGTKKIQFDVNSLSSGIYILTYLVDDQIIDSKKFNKK